MSTTKHWSIVLFLVLVTVSPQWARGQTASPPADPPSSNSAPPISSSVPKTPATTDRNYIIGPQDVVDISVWKEPEITRTVPVRPDGKVSLPLLNDVQAAGLTPSQLAVEITASLKKFVTDPEVTVIVTQINSQRVYLLGEVTRPGAYPLIPGMTVLQGLSSAGGFTQFANQKKIYVLRQTNGKQEKYPFNYKDVLSGKRPDDNILLRAGDTIVVP